jgi:HAD superfamily hydrolase (TIGR01509 family)
VIRALIFDFDGLVLDTETPEYQSYQEIYRSLGFELPLERWALGIGTTDAAYDPLDDLEALLVGELDRSGLQALQKQRNAELIATQPVRPGVVEYLHGARRLGLKTGMASSSPCSWITGHLSRLGLLGYFDCLQGRDDVYRSKPDPELYLNVLDKLGVSNSEAIVFEDSPNGILAARRAGIFTVAVPNQITRRLPLDGANLHLSSLADLPLEKLMGMVAVVQLSKPGGKT